MNVLTRNAFARRRLPVNFAPSAFGVRCVLASLLTPCGPISLLLTRSWHRDNKLAVFLGDEVFACVG